VYPPFPYSYYLYVYNMKHVEGGELHLMYF
jgi:hypothetical protein